MAVALDDDEPTDPPPVAIVWDQSALQQSNIQVGLRQIVFVGDGLTGIGIGPAQTFVLPPDATRLYLGFVDGYCGQSHGTYGDDSGSLSATLNYAGCLWLLSQPASLSVCPTASSSMSVTTAGMSLAQFRWQVEATPDDWVDVFDGPLPYTGGEIAVSESDTSSLQLTLNTRPTAPPIRFRCIVTNSCGSVTSNPATLVPCQSDLNCDDVVDDADFVVFAAAYNVLDCADPAMASGCPADLNGDGLVDDADFVQFVAAYNNLGCL